MSHFQRQEKIEDVYDLLNKEELREGGEGKIYLVRRVIDNHIFAIKKLKMMRKSISDKSIIKASAIREVRILQEITNPYVLHAREVYFTHMRYVCADERCIQIKPSSAKGYSIYLAMELYAGDLNDIVSEYIDPMIKKIKSGEATKEEIDKHISIIKTYMKMILESVACLHSHGIMHRDIKPENFLVSRDAKRIVISDFGTARRSVMNREGKYDANPTYTKSQFSPRYLSPEAEYGAYTMYTDLWSIGCVFAELVLGYPLLLKKDNQYTRLNFMCKLIGPPSEEDANAFNNMSLSAAYGIKKSEISTCEKMASIGNQTNQYQNPLETNNGLLLNIVNITPPNPIPPNENNQVTNLFKSNVPFKSNAPFNFNLNGNLVLHNQLSNGGEDGNKGGFFSMNMLPKCSDEDMCTSPCVDWEIKKDKITWDSLELEGIEDDTETADSLGDGYGFGVFSNISVRDKVCEHNEKCVSYTKEKITKLFSFVNKIPSASSYSGKDPFGSKPTFNERLNVDIFGSSCMSLIKSFLKWNPESRISAEDALKHPFFEEEPKPCDPNDLPNLKELLDVQKNKKKESDFTGLNGDCIFQNPGGESMHNYFDFYNSNIKPESILANGPSKACKTVRFDVPDMVTNHREGRTLYTKDELIRGRNYVNPNSRSYAENSEGMFQGEGETPYGFKATKVGSQIYYYDPSGDYGCVQDGDTDRKSGPDIDSLTFSYVVDGEQQEDIFLDPPVFYGEDMTRRSGVLCNSNSGSLGLDAEKSQSGCGKQRTYYAKDIIGERDRLNGVAAGGQQMMNSYMCNFCTFQEFGIENFKSCQAERERMTGGASDSTSSGRSYSCSPTDSGDSPGDLEGQNNQGELTDREYEDEINCSKRGADGVSGSKRNLIDEFDIETKKGSKKHNHKHSEKNGNGNNFKSQLMTPGLQGSFVASNSSPSVIYEADEGEHSSALMVLSIDELKTPGEPTRNRLDNDLLSISQLATQPDE